MHWDIPSLKISPLSNRTQPGTSVSIIFSNLYQHANIRYAVIVPENCQVSDTPIIVILLGEVGNTKMEQI